MKKILSNDFTTLILRLALVYAVLMVCRIVFYIYNIDTLGTITPQEVWGLFSGALVFDTVSVLYLYSVFILFSLLPFRFRGKAWYQAMLKWLYVLFGAIYIILNFCDSVYFHYAKKRLTSEEFHFAEESNTISILLKSLMENWYLVLGALALIYLMYFTYCKIKYRPTLIANPWRYFGVGVLVLGATSVLIIGGIRGGFSRTTRPVALSNATQYSASHTKAMLILSNPFCIIRTMAMQKLTYTKYFDDSALEKIYTPIHPATTPLDTTQFKPLNVVIFILESFSAEHSAFLNPDLYPNGGGYTPTLDSLMRLSHTFTNSYSNGRKSIDALPSIISSIPSLQTPFVLLPQSLAEIKGLPWLLASEGYHTAFFNGSPAGSMGFEAYMRLVGTQAIYSQNDYEKAMGSADRDGYWGIWDMPFLGYMKSTIDKMPEPFFASVFTLSSHHPFVVPKQFEESLPLGKTKIHRPIAYTDLALRNFFDSAHKEPWFKNTIFVFVADHVSSEIWAAKTSTPTGNSHIINFIYSPLHVAPVIDSQTTQQIDIMPTVLGVLDYNKPFFAFGRNCLNTIDSREHAAINYMNETFQCITDSTVYFFDGSKISHAYQTTDTLQQTNISDPMLPSQQKAELGIKAFLQQYYQHIERNSLTVE